jgi:2-methylfumaryl-CoA hydratase
MVAPWGRKSEPTTTIGQPFPEESVGAGSTRPGALTAPLPSVKSYPKDLTGTRTYFEDFTVGEIIIHPNGRTITDEHIGWTYRLLNTHPLHYDKVYTKNAKLSGTGETVVYGGLVFAWACGLASRDVSENALWDLGYTEGYHTQPAYSGDTVYAISRVLATNPPNPPFSKGGGMVQFQLIAVKNITGKEAVSKYGSDLFLKENDKRDMGKEKIPEKIFEIERQWLIKKRGKS